MSPTSPLEKCPSEVWEIIFSYLRDEDTLTLLACRAACLSFEYWTDKKTSFWTRIWTSLDSAVRDNNLDICCQIVRTVANKYPTENWAVKPLHLAAYFGHLDIYHLLMNSVEDKNPGVAAPKRNGSGLPGSPIPSVGVRDVKPLHLASCNRHYDMATLIFKSVEGENSAVEDGITPLHWAAKRGHLDICRLIIEGAEIKNPANHDGVTPLHCAAIRGHIDICQLLIQNGDAKNRATKYGDTPMHLAAERGYLEICRLIIDNEADKNPAYRHRLRHRGTALHAAAQNGHLDVCRLIMDNVEDKNPTDSDGWTPLHWAASKGHFDMCRLIVESVEDKNPADNEGMTPMNLAEKCGHGHICHLIRQHMADPSGIIHLNS